MTTAASTDLNASATVATILPPTLVAKSDSGARDHITNVTRPTFAGTFTENAAPLYVGYTVTLYDGAIKIGTALVLSTGGWSIVSGALAEGPHAMRLTLTDPIGAVAATSPVQQIEIRTHAEPPSTPVLLASVDSGSSDSDHVTNNNLLTISGTASAGATVALWDGATYLGRGVADRDGAWVVDNVLLDDGRHTLTAVATDIAENISAPSAALSLTIDTEAPLALGLQLAAGSDSGAAADGVTNVAAPVVTGRTEAGATVQLFDGQTQVGAAVADAQGNWSAASAALADGVHTLSVHITDIAGNATVAAGRLTVTVDTAAPAAPPAPVLAAASDSGLSATDGVTNVAAPRLDGTAEAGATVTLFDGDRAVGSAVANAENVWSITGVTLAPGAHNLTVTATDAAGNVSPASPALALTIDTGAPAAPSAPDLLAAYDSGTSDTDDITNADLPVLAGSAEAGARVALYDGTLLVGAGVADAAGNWQIAVTTALGNGAHSLTARATDAAGNVSPSSAALALIVDTTAALPPSELDLQAPSDSGASASDNLTNVATPTITGKAEAGARVTLFDGETRLGTAVADAQGVWRITSAALDDGVHQLTASSSALTGTVSAPSAALTVTIDTAAPDAPATPVLAPSADSGASDSDHLTNAATPLITGTAAAHASVVLYDGATVVATTTADATGAWRVATATLADGAHHLTATVTDAAGNTSPPSAALVVTVDTAAPAAAAPLLDAGSDSGRANADGITNDTTPTITGSTEAGATVKVFDGATQIGTTVSNADGAWSFTAGALAAGAHSLTATVTDVAGNTSTASAALGLVIDTAAAAPTALDLPDAADSGALATDNLTNVALPTITGKAEAGAEVSLYDGATLIGTALADADGNWRIAVTKALAEGPHNLTAQATDAAGNLSAQSAALVVTIDTTPLAAQTAPDLATASDSGASGSDNITSLAAPTVTGNAPAGATVHLYDGDTLVGATVAPASGAWSIVSATLADGAHQLTARSVDAAGNLSAPSAALAVTIDTAAPATPGAPLLDALSDSGRSNTDGVTNDTTPTITGTAEAGATVKLFDGATQIGAVVANAAGAWSLTSAAMGAGAHSLTTTVTDVAGNVSAASPALVVTIDTAVAEPTALDLLAGSDSGASNTDNITNVTLPTIGGMAEANASVSLYDGQTLLGTAQADAAGNWQVTVTQPLINGNHGLTAQATDAAGNLSARSPAFGVVIDTIPLPASAVDLMYASDSGGSSSDNITSMTKPAFTGTSTAGATVDLYDGDTLIGTKVVPTGGTWIIISGTALADGVHQITSRVTDVAGNVSAPSAALQVTIDTQAPDAPAALALDALSDTGRSSTDGITRDLTPTLTGTAEPGASVKVYDGATQLGAVSVGANGLWSFTTDALTAGTHSLTASATDAAGHTSARSSALVITIDRTEPTAPTLFDLVAASDSGASSTDNNTNVTLPTFTGKAEANASVSLFNGASTTVLGTGLADASGNWQITLTQALPTGFHTLTAVATDVAGNPSPSSAALHVTIDTTPFAAPAAPRLLSDSGASSIDNIINAATPRFYGITEVGATVTLFDGDTKVGTGLASGTEGYWYITSAKLADGVHHLTARITDLAGNVSAPSAELVVTIDTAAPAAPAAPVLDALSDSGRSDTDGITNDTTPIIAGTAEAGTSVTLFDGTSAVGTAMANAAGVWSYTYAALTSGVHQLTATATDIAGNVSAASSALVVTIDKAGPEAPTVPDLIAASDSGTSSTDNKTNVMLPTFTGKTEANASVSLFDGATVVGTALADAAGNWQITVAQALADGTHNLSAQSADVAGNLSARSAALSVVVDTAGLAAPGAPDLLATSDRGVSNTDNITNLATPTITGSAVAGATVNLYNNDVKVGTTTAGNTGIWSIAIGPLSNAVHHLTARTVDPAGNLSAPSTALDVTVDTMLGAVSAPDLAAGADSGASTTDNVTNNAQPVFTGTADADATVSIYDGNELLGTTQADGAGAWSYTGATLADGVHSIVARANDVAGNASVGAALSVTIDTVAPVLVDSNSAGNMANLGAPANSTVGVTASGAGPGGKYSLVSNPGNLFAIDADTGIIRMPDSALMTGGAHDVTVQAVDLAGNSASGVFTITGNTAPTISAIADVTTREDTYSNALAFTIGDGETAPRGLTLSATSSTIPVNVIFGGSGADRTISVVGAANQSGTTTITVSVKDAGGLVSTSSFVATITPVDDTSMPQSDIRATTEDGSVTVTKASLLANDIDIDSAAPSSIISVSAISGGTAAISGGNVVFSASTSAHGLGHYSYRVGDGGVGDVWIKLAPVSMDGDYTFEIQQMYIGYFGRPADKGGLAHKLALIGNQPISDAASQAQALKLIGEEFMVSDEYKAVWQPGVTSNHDMVKMVFQNLFNRLPEAAGWAHWEGMLDSGELTPATLVLAIGQSALTSDLAIVTNKTYVAQYFTEQMTTKQNESYIGGATPVVKNFLTAVTASDGSVINAAESTADTIVAATGGAMTSGAMMMTARQVADDSGTLMLQGTSGSEQFLQAGDSTFGFGDGQAVTLVGVAAAHDLPWI